MKLFKIFDTSTNRHVARAFAFQQEVPTGTVDGSNTDFVLSVTPTANTIVVYLDRLYVLTSEYSVNIGTKTITFNTPPALGQTVAVLYIKD